MHEVVVLFESSAQPELPGHLVAYVESAPGRSVTQTKLRAFLKARLHPGMLPKRIILGPIPLNSNGKIDRKFLESKLVEGTV